MTYAVNLRCRSFGARPIPKELVCASRGDELALLQRICEISTILKAWIEKIAHARSLSQAEIGTC